MPPDSFRGVGPIFCSDIYVGVSRDFDGWMDGWMDLRLMKHTGNTTRL